MMERGLNKVMIIGELGREPEMRYTPSGRPVTTFNVSSTRSWNSSDGERHSETEWFNVVAWGSLAEMLIEEVSITDFPDREINLKVECDVRGADVFVVQPTCPPVHDSLFELLSFIDCLRRASAENITAVVITSDRGLCGGFNTNVIRYTGRALKAWESKDVQIVAAGRKGYDYFRRRGLDVEKADDDLLKHLDYPRAAALGHRVLNLDVRKTQATAILVFEALDYIRWGTDPAYARVGGRMVAGHHYYKLLEPGRGRRAGRPGGGGGGQAAAP